jgi:PRTRC genetic system protein D
MNIGTDLGYYRTKAMCEDRYADFLSIVGTPDKSRFSLNNHNAITLIKPNHVQVGEAAVNQSRFLNRREDRRWIESDEYLNLFYAAMSELTTATRANLLMVTGLPVAFFDDRETVKSRFLGTHTIQREDRHAQTLTVTACHVIPQPFGTLLSVVLDDNGRIVDNRLATGEVGVIDIGGKTTNLLSVSSLSEISRETASINAGGWDLVRSARAHLAQECPDLDLRDHQIADAIIEKEIRYYGEPIDIGNFVDAETGYLGSQIVAQATQLWNSGAGLDAILITGGGAMLLCDYIERHFPHATVVGDPAFANAFGYWKFAQRLDTR